MEYYFYLDAQRERKGPVAAAELIRDGITRDTLVWKEGMAQWQPAGELPELQELFAGAAVPPEPPAGCPAVPPAPPQEPAGQKPDSLLVWSILATFLCCLPTGVVAIIYSTKVDSLWGAGKYEEARKAARIAKAFCLVSFGLSVVYLCVIIVCLVIGLVGS